MAYLALRRSFPSPGPDTGGRGWIDMFWPGQITVEHKSKGKDLAAATQQCLTYLGLVTAFLPTPQFVFTPMVTAPAIRQKTLPA